jgi:transcriptional regulator with XRE-family HTH domain
MTPVQFKDARKALGLTQKECAKTLGLKTSRAIRQYEAGERQVSGPVAVLIAMLLEQANGNQCQSRAQRGLEGFSGANGNQRTGGPINE